LKDSYNGQWNFNLKEGKGILQRKNGERYEGQLFNDQINGYGTLYLSFGS